MFLYFSFSFHLYHGGYLYGLFPMGQVSWFCSILDF